MDAGVERARTAVSLPQVGEEFTARLAGLFGAARPYLVALVLVGFTSLLLHAMQAVIDPRDSVVLFLVPILFCALRYGQSTALFASALSVTSSALFTYEPYFSIWVADRRYVAYLVVFTMTALAVGRIAHSAQRSAHALAARTREAEALYGFSRQLASASSQSAIYAAIREHLATQLGQRFVLVVPDGTRSTEIDTVDGVVVPPSVSTVVGKALLGADIGNYAEIPDESGDIVWLVKAIRSDRPGLGVVVIRAPAGGSEGQDWRRRMDAAMQDAAVSFERIDIGEAIEASRQRASAETLREALIGSVTHELRTPLSTIMGSASILAKAPIVQGESQLSSLVALIDNASAQLDLKIANLIDSTRISTASLKPRSVWVDPTDVVNAAIADCSSQLARHKVQREIPLDAPLVQTDPMLLKEAIRQLLDNAAKYSPAGSTIGVVLAQTSERALALSVVDQGDGMTAQEIAVACDRFSRGRRHAGTTAGSGLGLWIAQSLAAACDACLELASEGPGRGTTASIVLPIPESAPTPNDGDVID